MMWLVIGSGPKGVKSSCNMYTPGVRPKNHTWPVSSVVWVSIMTPPASNKSIFLPGRLTSQAGSVASRMPSAFRSSKP